MKWIGLILLQIVVMCVILFMIITYQPRERVIDCTWVEIMPDIPPKIKEDCRKLNAKKIIYTRRTGEDWDG